MSLAALPPASREITAHIQRAARHRQRIHIEASIGARPEIPEPRADQLLPFHCAMLVAAIPPAVVKSPPAYNVLPDTASATT